MPPRNSERPRRLTAQQQQETLSRSQFEEALDGWICNPLSRDFGEDYLISIYDDERWSTGLSFSVQLKSVGDWKKVASTTHQQEIRYPLKVKDLLHWEDSSPPVVIVIWNVATKIGFWEDVPAIIKRLDDAGFGWRKQRSVKAPVPTNQTIDRSGRKDLRQRIGTLALSTIAMGRRLEVTQRFRDTPEAQAQRRALQRAVEEGDEFTIEGKHLSEFALSDWWERIFGRVDPSLVTISPSPSKAIVPFLLRAVGVGAPETVHTPLVHVKQGTKVGVFESPPGHPLRMQLTYDSRSDPIKLRVSLSFPCDDVQASLELVRFLVAVRRGATAQLGVSNGRKATIPIGGFKVRHTEEELNFWYKILIQLSEIQPRVSKYGTFSLPQLITDEDLDVLRRMHAMCTSGRLEIDGGFEMEFNGPLKKVPSTDTSRSLEPDLVVWMDPHEDLNLFGVCVPAGKVRVTFEKDKGISRQLDEARASGEQKVKLNGTSATLTFLDWQGPNSGPVSAVRPAIEVTAAHGEELG